MINRLLVADDQPPSRDARRRPLKGEGFVPTLATSPAEAVLELAGARSQGVYSSADCEEIIRMALGSPRTAVLRLGAALVGIGGLVGLLTALALGRLLTSVLCGVSRADPATLVVGSLVLGAAALLACLLSARRVPRVDPMVALRNK